MITIDEIKNVSFRKAGRQGYMMHLLMKSL